MHESGRCARASRAVANTMTTSSIDTSSLRIHAVRALQAGPRLIVLGAVHGNETCGTRAIERALEEFDSGALRLTRGSATLVPVTNPLAYERGQRMGERNLNRNLRISDDPVDNEDRIGNVLCPLLAEHDVLLDLHSFHAPGEPFAMIGPSDNAGTLEPFSHAHEEEALALRLGPRRIVEGWLEAYASGVKNRLQRVGANPSARAQLLNTDPAYGVGTTEYMRSRGGYAITLECGQHADPQAPQVAYRAIRPRWPTWGWSRKLRHRRAPMSNCCASPRSLTATTPTTASRVTGPATRALRGGEVIAHRADGTPLRAPDDGFIVFPNPNALPGNEWFYFARKSKRHLGAKEAR